MYCYDHLGNRYKSKIEMCEKYGITVTWLNARLYEGMELKDALEEGMMTKKRENAGIEVQDHLGNKYRSISAMCREYGVSTSGYKHKIKNGLSIEEALTGGLRAVYDHLGNKYLNKVEMCKTYNMSSTVFAYRMKNGWTLEEALTTPKHKVRFSKGNVCCDAEGNVYRSKLEMCEAHGVKYATFNARMSKGESLKDALRTKETVKAKKVYVDSKGNSYASMKELISAYGITNNTYYSRRALGWSREEALTGVHNAIRKKRDRVITDHLGNKYNTLKEMCNAWGIELYNYERRRRKGWSMEEILTTPGTKIDKEEKQNIDIARMAMVGAAIM